ncbi:hypothetical protein GQ43DRAFT_475900 [Delitschia confertaspora ATCC 74209]|uniref:EKC/KEOPS complex subunit BUD32 n=1 Tax=Delitschia confertaspora ATCC 74209 TaxID=1513339 RepID=A0A9P4JCU0_9PLEO|nr:hypothetical protein GQ43DRAFT_475900 [Delitschia confertaspora ATCC 74209]
MSGHQKSLLLRHLGYIAVGFEHLHQYIIRHRDISPGNIFIHQRRAKIADFDATFNAKNNPGRHGHADPKSSPNSQVHASEVEESSYNAPQADNCKFDIFSIGATFVEVLLQTRSIEISDCIGTTIIASGGNGKQCGRS